MKIYRYFPDLTQVSQYDAADLGEVLQSCQKIIPQVDRLSHCYWSSYPSLRILENKSITKMFPFIFQT